MEIQFATTGWAEALQRAINASTPYRSAAKDWEGDFWFVVEPDSDAAAPAPAATFMYLDLWHGACRSAFVADGSEALDPEFSIRANTRGWSRVIGMQVDPIRALLTGVLKLDGSLAKVMRNVRAAQELVLCAAAVPTRFELR